MGKHYVNKAPNVIDAHAIVSVQHNVLAAGADL